VALTRVYFSHPADQLLTYQQIQDSSLHPAHAGRGASVTIAAVCDGEAA